MKTTAEDSKLFFSTSLLLCVAETPRAQYGGGIIINPGFDHSIDGWTVFENGSIEERISNAGNRFIVVGNRTQPSDSFSQKVQLKKGMLYNFTAWFQLSEGSDTVSVIFKTNATELIRGGHVVAKHGCWTLLKGGILTNYSSPAEIFFETKNSKLEIWADSVSLQPFTKEQWRSHQDESIETVRKSKVRFQIIHTNETTLEGASVTIKPKKSLFSHLDFASRFKYTTFANAMKWYSTEEIQGQENYTIADALMDFTKENDISPKWVKSLSSDELREAVETRINSVVSRHEGELIAWDVVNENLHFSFFEDNLGKNASAEYFSKTYQLDPKPLLFTNEYNTIEYSGDRAPSPANYIAKMTKIRSFPGNEGISAAIGLQGHFTAGQPNLTYMRASLDAFDTTSLPIWLTEVSVDSDPNQAEHLEEILREEYSHPSVEGIIMFVGPAIAAGFKDMALTDENFQNTPAGDVVDKLISEWQTEPQKAIADSTGFIHFSLHHGDYDVTVTHPLGHSSKTLNLSVRKDCTQQTIHVKMHS
ncbi:hypothetical protein AAHE18_19G261700 [Arachis hypogaea]